MFKRLGEIPHEISFVLRNGTGNQALKGTASVAIGTGVVSIGSNQTVLGRYNIPDRNAQFIIGSGESDTERETAFHIDQDGNSHMAGGDIMILDEVTGNYVPVYAQINGDIMPVRKKHV